MLAVGRDDRVIGRERLHRPDRDRLLADVQVEEAPDLAGAVELRRLLLEMADEQHLPQELVRVLALEGDAVRRPVLD